MMLLPKIRGKVQEHNAPYTKKGERFVPNTSIYADFWNAFYKKLAQSDVFESPVRGLKKKINPYFGRFGVRWDPDTRNDLSYHTGIDIESRRKTNVSAVADGVLEYAGYGVINGKYIMLSHPEIVTEDGFVLRTLYMHLDSFKVSFSSYQKMLRQISMNTYPVIPVQKKQTVGTVGKTGTSSYPKEYTHLHVQAEFHHKDGVVVLIDAGRMLGLEDQHNLTAGLTTKKQFIDIYLKNRKDIYNRKLQNVWKEYIDDMKK